MLLAGFFWGGFLKGGGRLGVCAFLQGASPQSADRDIDMGTQYLGSSSIRKHDIARQLAFYGGNIFRGEGCTCTCNNGCVSLFSLCVWAL
jgi:hypothetical protein